MAARQGRRHRCGMPWRPRRPSRQRRPASRCCPRSGTEPGPGHQPRGLRCLPRPRRPARRRSLQRSANSKKTPWPQTGTQRNDFSDVCHRVSSNEIPNITPDIQILFQPDLPAVLFGPPFRVSIIGLVTFLCRVEARLNSRRADAAPCQSGSSPVLSNKVNWASSST